jgi:hypothetical protein
VTGLRWRRVVSSSSGPFGTRFDAAHHSPFHDEMGEYTPEKRDENDREKVLGRLTPRALHELYIETKNLSVEQRQMGHRAECDLCGEMVDLDQAIPNARGEPCHKRCWAEYTGAPDWFNEYV